MYVRDALVMANYDENIKEQYQIAKADYEAFKNKYAIKK